MVYSIATAFQDDPRLDVDRRDVDGYTPLHVALLHGKSCITKHRLARVAEDNVGLAVQCSGDKSSCAMLWLGAYL